MNGRVTGDSSSILFLINEIAERKITGTLGIRNIEPSFDLVFKSGKLHYTYSVPEEDFFVDYIKKSTGSDSPEFDSSCRIFRGGLVYSNIIASGALPKNKLDSIFTAYSKDCLKKIFSTDNAELFFDKGTAKTAPDAPDIHQLISEIFETMDVKAMASARYVDTTVSVKLDMDKLVNNSDLSPELGYIATRIGGICQLSELVLSIGFPEDKVKQSIFELEMRGIVSIRPLPAKQVMLGQLGPIPTAASRQEVPARKNQLKTEVQAKTEKEQNENEFDVSYVEKFYLSLKSRDFYSILGVNSTAHLREIRESYLNLARKLHPDRIHGYNDSSIQDKLEMIFASINEAYDTLKDTKKRQAYNMGRTESIRQSTLDKPAQAREIFDTGIKYFNKKDFHNATEMFMKAVNLNPTSRYYTYLGRTQSMNKNWLKKAEDSFKEAIRLSANDWEAHYHLGVLYKNMNMTARANKCFNEALKLSPGNEEILAAMQG